jgi:tetratricopeptide (TPR) repeat protein
VKPSEVLKDPKIGGQLAAAIVVMLIALALLPISAKRRYEQYLLRSAVSEFYASRMLPHGTVSLAEAKARFSKRRARARQGLSASSDPRRYALLGALAREEGSLDRAERLYARGIDLDLPGDPSALLGAASVSLDRAVGGDADALTAARDFAGQAADLDGAFGAAVVRGAARLLEGDAAGASELFESCLGDLDGGSLPSRDALAALYWNHGLAQFLSRDEACIENFKKALQLSPNTRGASRTLARAIIVFLCQAEASPEQLVRRVEIGDQLLRQKISIGRRSFYLCGFDGPEAARISNAIGVALTRLGRHKEAIKRFHFALRRDRRNPSFNRNRGIAAAAATLALPEGGLRVTAHREAAKAFGNAFDCADKADPERSTVLRHAVLHALQGRDYAFASKLLDRAVSAGTELAESYRLKGIVSFRQRQRREAGAFFQKAVEAGHPDATELEVFIEALGR